MYRSFSQRLRDRAVVTAVAVSLVATQSMAASVPLAPNDDNTTSPIKHVIVLIGENRTFDHVFATYQPKHGGSVGNLLSRGIIDSNGGPGSNAALATQNQVNTPLPATYFIKWNNKTAESTLPTPELN